MSDTEKKSPRMTLEYLGYEIREINHEFFGEKSVKVFCIKLGKILKTTNLPKQLRLF